MRTAEIERFTALYVIAACGPLLLSGYRHVAVFGIVNLAAVVIIARLTASGSPRSGAGGQPCPAAPSRCIAATRGLTATTPSPGLTASSPTGERASRPGIARPPAFHSRPNACRRRKLTIGLSINASRPRGPVAPIGRGEDSSTAR